MPTAVDVTPHDWMGVSVVYDDGIYSVVWSHFRDDTKKALGVRWNGSEGTLGFQNSFGNPTWYVEPAVLSEPILIGLLGKVLASGGKLERYVDNLLQAIRETKQLPH